MKTEVVKIDPQNVDLEKIKRAAELIKKGAIVAFPTETVYGLGADFLNQQAVNRIFEIKKRSHDKPLPVQIHDIAYLEDLVCDIPAFAYQLMSKFWPGPLTLVLPARNGGTIGVRIPDNRIAQSLIKISQTPLVAPSANVSGQVPAKTAEEVIKSFDGIIEMVIDGGKTELGVASTVIDLSTGIDPPHSFKGGVLSTGIDPPHSFKGGVLSTGIDHSTSLKGRVLSTGIDPSTSLKGRVLSISPLKILREGAISQKDIQSVQI